MNPEEIKEDFPILLQEIHGQPLVYFDNAATSEKPTQVIEAVKEFYEKYNANIHRGIHNLSQKASELYENAHDEVAKFINAGGREEIIFVRNTTEAINLVAHSYGRKLHEDDEVVTTIMEHHSNILPWEVLAKRKGIKVKYVEVEENGTFNYDAFKEAITENTKLVTITHVSNVLGTINEVERVTQLAHNKDALILIDGAQSAPHMPVDVQEIDCDFFAFSGHKMIGPTGIGALYVKKKSLSRLSPYQEGGGMIDSVNWKAEEKKCSITRKGPPWKFEAGTPNIAGGIGFAEAVKYLEKIGMENIREHEKELTSYALDRIEDETEGVKIYGPRDPEIRGGILSFTVKNTSLSYHDVAAIFNEYGICVRSGFHCAQPLHEYLGSEGTVRASFYLYNTEKEVDKFINILKQIEKM